MLRETLKKQIVINANRRSAEPLRGREGFVETPDHQALHYTIYGETGHILVLSDGVGCDGYIWKYLIPELSKHYRVLHWQYRGHGQSSALRDYESLTIERMARDLACIVAEVCDETPVFVGHSMGVQVILEYHRLFGDEKMKALIPICGAAGKTLDTFMNARVMRDIFPYLLHFFRTAPKAASIVWNNLIATPYGYYPALLLQLTSTLCSPQDLQPYLEHLGRIDARVFMELARDMGIHSAENHLPNIHVPALVFVADRDTFTPVEKSCVLAERIPEAELCMARGATHTAPLELPLLFNLRIEKFLNERVF